MKAKKVKKVKTEKEAWELVLRYLKNQIHFDFYDAYEGPDEDGPPREGICDSIWYLESLIPIRVQDKMRDKIDKLLESKGKDPEGDFAWKIPSPARFAWIKKQIKECETNPAG